CRVHQRRSENARAPPSGWHLSEPSKSSGDFQDLAVWTADQGGSDRVQGGEDRRQEVDDRIQPYHGWAAGIAPLLDRSGPGLVPVGGFSIHPLLRARQQDCRIALCAMPFPSSWTATPVPQAEPTSARIQHGRRGGAITQEKPNGDKDS